MDKKNGFGTLYMVNGDKFSGCFVNDVIEGYGTFTSYKGERVSGIWTQNILKKFWIFIIIYFYILTVIKCK